LGFTVLTRPLFFQIFILYYTINLFICKHRIGFYASWAEVITMGICNTI
jgi:hypothetical protein